MANPFFNATYYLANNPDLVAAGINTADGAWAHYVNYGASEAINGAASRVPAPWFDINYYLSSNPDLLTAGIAPGDLFAHFTTYGINEGRAPSAEAAGQMTEANLLAYALGNPDLMTAFGVEAGATSLTAEQQQGLANQYYAYGYNEGRANAPFDINDDVGETFTLTTGVDTYTGGAGDDLFVSGEVNGLKTLTAGDTLDGGAGVDTLHVSASTVENYAGFVSSNIEVLNTTSDGAGLTFDLSGTTGLTTLQSTNSAAPVTFNQVTSLANLEVINMTAAPVASNVTVQYQNPVVAGDTAVGLLLNSSAVGTLTLGSVADANGGVETLDVNVAGGNSTVAQIDTDLTTLNIAGDGSSLTVTTALNATTRTVDAADFTGDLTLTTSAAPTANVAVTSGAGDDNITLAAAINTVDTGAGADTVTMSAADLTVSDTITLGAGVDRLIFNGAGGETVDSTESLKLSHVEVVDIRENNTTFAVTNNLLATAEDGSFTVETAGITAGAARGSINNVIDLTRLASVDGFKYVGYAEEGAVNTGAVAGAGDRVIVGEIQMNGTASFAFNATQAASRPVLEVRNSANITADDMSGVTVQGNNGLILNLFSEFAAGQTIRVDVAGLPANTTIRVDASLTGNTVILENPSGAALPTGLTVFDAAGGATLTNTAGVTATNNDPSFGDLVVPFSDGDTIVASTTDNETFQGAIADLVGTTITGNAIAQQTLSITDNGVVNIPGAITAMDTIRLADGGNTLIGAVATGATQIFGGTGLDAMQLAAGDNISTIDLNSIERLDVAATATMTVAQHNASSVIGDGASVITLTDAGTFIGALGVEGYVAGNGTNNVTLTAAQTGAGGVAYTGGTGADTVSISSVDAIAVTGSVDGGALGEANVLNVTTGVAGALDLSTQFSNFDVVNLQAGSTASVTLFNGADVVVNAGAASTVVLGTSGQTFNGSAGDDSVTLGTGSDTINLTAGGDDDVVIGGAAGAPTAGTANAITGFSVASDQIDLNAIFGGVGTIAAVADLTLVDTNSVMIVTAALSTAEITTQIDAGANGTEAFALVFNSSTGRAELWHDTDWDNIAGRDMVASFNDITTLGGTTAFGATEFIL